MPQHDPFGGYRERLSRLQGLLESYRQRLARFKTTQPPRLPIEEFAVAPAEQPAARPRPIAPPTDIALRRIAAPERPEPPVTVAAPAPQIRPAVPRPVTTPGVPVTPFREFALAVPEALERRAEPFVPPTRVELPQPAARLAAAEPVIAPAPAPPRIPAPEPGRVRVRLGAVTQPMEDEPRRIPTPPAKPEDRPALGELGSGFWAGMTGQNPEMLGAALETMGLEKLGRGLRQIGTKAVERRPPRVPSLDEVRDPDDLIDWAAYGLGQGIASTLPSMIGALGLGGVGLVTAGPPGALALSAIGALTPAFMLNVGDMRNELEAEGLKDREAIARWSMVGGALLSMLDAPLPAFIASRVLGGLPRDAARERIKRGIVRRVLAAAATGAAIEAPTEFTQAVTAQALARRATEKPLDIEWQRAIEEGVIGGLVGLALGSAAGIAPDRPTGRIARDMARARRPEDVERVQEHVRADRELDDADKTLLTLALEQEKRRLAERPVEEPVPPPEEPAPPIIEPPPPRAPAVPLAPTVAEAERPVQVFLEAIRDAPDRTRLAELRFRIEGSEALTGPEQTMLLGAIRAREELMPPLIAPPAEPAAPEITDVMPPPAMAPTPGPEPEPPAPGAVEISAPLRELVLRRDPDVAERIGLGKPLAELVNRQLAELSIQAGAWATARDPELGAEGERLVRLAREEWRRRGWADLPDPAELGRMVARTPIVQPEPMSAEVVAPPTVPVAAEPTAEAPVPEPQIAPAPPPDVPAVPERALPEVTAAQAPTPETVAERWTVPTEMNPAALRYSDDYIAEQITGVRGPKRREEARSIARRDHWTAVLAAVRTGQLSVRQASRLGYERQHELLQRARDEFILSPAGFVQTAQLDPVERATQQPVIEAFGATEHVRARIAAGDPTVSADDARAAIEAALRVTGFVRIGDDIVSIAPSTKVGLPEQVARWGVGLQPMPPGWTGYEVWSNHVSLGVETRLDNAIQTATEHALTQRLADIAYEQVLARGVATPEDAEFVYREAPETLRRYGRDVDPIRHGLGAVASVAFDPKSPDRSLVVELVPTVIDITAETYQDALAVVANRLRELVDRKAVLPEKVRLWRYEETFIADPGQRLRDKRDTLSAWISDWESNAPILPVTRELMDVQRSVEGLEAAANALEAMPHAGPEIRDAIVRAREGLAATRTAIEAVVQRVRNELAETEAEFAQVGRERARTAIPLNQFKTTLARAWAVDRTRVTADDSPIQADGHAAFMPDAVPKRKGSKLAALMRRKPPVVEQPIRLDENHKVWMARETIVPAEIVGVVEDKALLQREDGSPLWVDVNKLRYFVDLLEPTAVQVTTPDTHPYDSAVGLYQGARRVALIMALRTPDPGWVDIAAMREHLGLPPKPGTPEPGPLPPAPRRGSVHPARAAFLEGGPKGPFERLPATIPTSSYELLPVDPVELGRMAFELLRGYRVFVKRFPKARGAFYPDERVIRLHPDLGRDYEELMKVLGHEIGHLWDFLPDETLGRGNILGHIATLQRYVMDSIAALPDVPTRALTKADRQRLRKEAIRQVGTRPPSDEAADLAEWSRRVSETYRELLEDEMEARGLIGRQRVHEELVALAQWWFPYQREIAPESYIRYREGAKELYATAVSVLLNSPGSLQERAPTFYDAFFAYFERKPEVREIYNEIQRLARRGPEAIATLRRAELLGDWARTEEKAREATEERDKQGFFSSAIQTMIYGLHPLARVEAKEDPDTPHFQRRLRQAYREFMLRDNVNMLQLEDIYRHIEVPTRAVGLSHNDMNEYLFLMRIAEGDRGGNQERARQAIMAATGMSTWSEARETYASWRESDPDEFDAALLELADKGYINPRNYTPEEARKQLADLRRALGEERWAVLEAAARRLHEIFWESVAEAIRVGVYNESVGKTVLEPNKYTYVPFANLELWNGTMPAALRKQTGQFGPVAAPYTTLLLKMMALNRANELQKFWTTALPYIERSFPDSIGPEERVDLFHRVKPPPRGRKNIFYWVNGQLRYRSVSAYIADVIETSDVGRLARITNTLGSATYRIFHPLLVRWSISWLLRNPWRDWKRTYQALAVARRGQPTYRRALGALGDIFRLNLAYLRSVGAAWRYAREREDPLVRQMLEDRALGRLFHSYDPFESDDTTTRLLKRYGFYDAEYEGVEWRRYRVAWPVRVLERVGEFQELLSKAALWKALTSMGITGRERAYIVSEYAGTPNSTIRGVGGDAANAIWMYYRVQMADIRATLELATHPATAADYWFRTVITDYSWKIMMVAAASGYLGDWLKEWYAHVPALDKAKYIIIPVPPFLVPRVDGTGYKAVYFRLPHADFSRIPIGTLWTLIMDRRPEAFSYGASILAGEFPGLNIPLDNAWKWFQTAIGRRAYDSFRGRYVIPPREWEAGGWARWKEMIRHTLGDFGVVSQVMGRFTLAEPAEQITNQEQWLRSIPGLSALIRISDRGLTESQRWELDFESRERARLLLLLPDKVRRATSERNFYNQLGEEKLTKAQRRRRTMLNTWYRREYLPITARMEDAYDAGDEAEARRLAGELGERLTRYLQYRPPRRREIWPEER